MTFFSGTYGAMVPIAPHATVLFGGDMMFESYDPYDSQGEGRDFLFSCIDPLLREQDAVVANLEGPITPNPSVSATSTPGTHST